MQMIVSGLSCRVAATLNGQSGAGAMGLSTPNRVATGNLNFATRRPQIGQYFALSRVTTLRISHARGAELGFLKDPAVIRLWLSIQELINLSDRMGLTITAILPAQQKFAAFLLAWSGYFGTVEEGPHDWMRYCDGNDSPYTRPARVEALLEEAVASTTPH